MKVAITGHSSGIGEELLSVIELTEPTWEVKGFSKANGHNIATNEGDDIVQEILDYDPCVFQQRLLSEDTKQNTKKTIRSLE